MTIQSVNFKDITTGGLSPLVQRGHLAGAD